MEHFLEYTREAAAQMEREACRLAAEERKDEANLAKVRGNIYEICQVIYNVNVNLTDGEDRKARCLTKWAELREAWSASRAMAQAHGDVEKAVIEEVKLETLAELEAKFLEEWGR